MGNTLFSTPIWYPGCQERDTFEKAMQRARASQQLVNGTLPADEFLDLIDGHGFDVFSFLDGWQTELEELLSKPCCQ